MKSKLLIFFIPVLIFLILSKILSVEKKVISPLNYDFPEQKQVEDPEKKEYKFQPVSLNNIFENNENFSDEISQEKLIIVAATGDVIPSRSVNYQTSIRKNYKWAFEKTADILRNADITLINLEAPLLEDCPLTNTGMIFCGDKKHIEGLIFSGIDIANLANNHTGNYGKNGIESTFKILNQAGILATGVSGAVYKDIKGIKFAFLGYNNITGGELLSWANPEKIKSEVANAQKNADIVIVSFHWGDEYVAQPNKKQKELAHLAINSGADLIIGNHPHWIQPVEIYKEKVITYAHGNFIFDQMWSEKTKEGVIGKYYFYKNKLIDVEFLPVYIKDYGQPEIVSGRHKEKILEEMKNESLKLGGI